MFMPGMDGEKLAKEIKSDPPLVFKFPCDDVLGWNCLRKEDKAVGTFRGISAKTPKENPTV